MDSATARNESVGENFVSRSVHNKIDSDRFAPSGTGGLRGQGLGESGENSNQWFRDCVALVERNHIGWAWWPHKKVESTSCTLTIKSPDDFKKVVDYWNKSGERPSREVAARALFALAENCKAGNCRFNAEVVRALIPSGSVTSALSRSASAARVISHW